MTGVRWYVGVPASGKTTLAAAQAAELVAATGWPVLAIDSAGVAQLGQVPHVTSVEAVLDHAWTRRQHVAFIPRDEDQVTEIVQAVLARGRVILLVDEAAFWIDARKGSGSPLLRLMRAHRHARVFLLLTTQHFSGDVSQQALSCAPTLYVFRCTSPAVLDRLEREYGLDRRAIANLGQGQFIKVESGFST